MEANNREIALLFWLGVSLLFLILKRDLRASLGGVVAAFLTPTILVPLVAFLGYVSGIVLAAEAVGLWNEDLLNETVLWLVATGFALFFNIERVWTEDDFFGRTVTRTIRVGILVEVFINLVVFPLPVELVLLPTATLLMMLSAFSASDPQYADAKKLTDGLLGVIGSGVLLFVAINLLLDPGQVAPGHALLALALPIWLTVGVLPFIYGVGLYAAYDRAFTRFEFLAQDRAASRRAKLALLVGLRFRARRVGDFGGPWLPQLVAAPSLSDARDVVDCFSRQG